jgi:BirA family biotin operon repressor/biotin-[acetyl-CoA-carboxylase] ligase
LDDPLDPEELARPGAGIGHTVIVKQRTGSTNDDAKELAEKGASHGTVVVAEEQERGRGRLDRTWHSPPGVNLLFSVILRPGLEPERAGLITIAAGVAAAEAVRGLCGLETRIKWPNDVRIKGRKLAGILAEAESRMSYVVLGMGINVNLEPSRMPDEIKDTAASILAETKKRFKRAEVFRAVMEELERVLGLVERNDTQKVIESWMELSEAMGRKVKAKTPAETHVGTAVGVREDGALLIRDSETSRDIAVIAGDVTIIE